MACFPFAPLLPPLRRYDCRRPAFACSDIGNMSTTISCLGLRRLGGGGNGAARGCRPRKRARRSTTNHPDQPFCLFFPNLLSMHPPPDLAGCMQVKDEPAVRVSKVDAWVAGPSSPPPSTAALHCDPLAPLAAPPPRSTLHYCSICIVLSSTVAWRTGCDTVLLYYYTCISRVNLQRCYQSHWGRFNVGKTAPEDEANNTCSLEYIV